MEAPVLLRRLDTVWRFIRAMRGSVIAFVIAGLLGFIGMGVVGALLYYPVAPALPSHYPPFDAWRGDWVWPVIIVVGSLWSFGFLIAGALNQTLIRANRSRWQRRLAYLLVLWLWAWLLWLAMLATNSPY